MLKIYLAFQGLSETSNLQNHPERSQTQIGTICLSLFGYSEFRSTSKRAGWGGSGNLRIEESPKLAVDPAPKIKMTMQLGRDHKKIYLRTCQPSNISMKSLYIYNVLLLGFPRAW